MLVVVRLVALVVFEGTTATQRASNVLRVVVVWCVAHPILPSHPKSGMSHLSVWDVCAICRRPASSVRGVRVGCAPATPSACAPRRTLSHCCPTQLCRRCSAASWPLCCCNSRWAGLTLAPDTAQDVQLGTVFVCGQPVGVRPPPPYTWRKTGDII